MKYQEFGWLFLLAMLALASAINPRLWAQEAEKTAAVKAVVNHQIIEELSEGLTSFRLESNQPNPFSEKTTARFAVPEKSEISLKIYNSDWQPVRTIYNGVIEKGLYEFEWDGKNDQNKPVPQGTYYYRLKSGKFDNVCPMYFVD